MTDEKKRLILESEDYEEINGFIFLNGMFRINMFSSAPSKEFRPKCADMDVMNEIIGIKTEFPICSFETCLRWSICPYRPK